ncbi:MAG: helix-turn-helix transcriptional regulator [Bacteroidales bacterium]|nr:helix-turn-helix transcriptional regulator [Bacteroidales bacterium]
MEVVFLIGSIQSFFLAVLLFSKKNKNQADIFLTLWFFMAGLALADNYLRNTGFVFENPHFLGLTYCIPMITGPFIFMYTLLLINKNAKIKYIHILHAFPLIFFTCYFLLNYYFLSAPEKLEYFHQMGDNPVFMIYAAEFFLVFSGPAYTVFALFLLRKHSKNLKNNFSYTEKINLNWLRFILIAGFALSVVSLLTNLLSDIFPVFPYWVGDNIAYGGIVILVFFMGYYGMKQPAIYKGISLEEAKDAIRNHALSGQSNSVEVKKRNINHDTEKYKSSGLKPDDAEKYLKTLLEYLENEEPYFESNLTLKMVSDSINISTNYISQIINEKLNLNFFDFINNYRVEQVKKCFSDPKFNHYSILGIAFECGFNSKSSFNSIFKKATKLTPSEFQKSILV